MFRQTAIAKELKEVVKSLQESLDHYSDIDTKLQLQVFAKYFVFWI